MAADVVTGSFRTLMTHQLSLPYIFPSRGDCLLSVHASNGRSVLPGVSLWGRGMIERKEQAVIIENHANS